MQQQSEARRGQQVALEAKRIVSATRRTSYGRGVLADPTAGTYVTDCKGFVGLVLEGAAPVHYAAIPRGRDREYPGAFEFYDYLASRSIEAPLGWRRLECFDDVAEGDVIAWRGERIASDQDTGHVLIVAGPPHPVTADVWAVRVYDSSNVPHFDDSRGSGGSFRGGVGSGAVVVHVSSRARAIGFQFGVDDDLRELPMVVGRLEPLTYAERDAAE